MCALYGGCQLPNAHTEGPYIAVMFSVAVVPVSSQSISWIDVLISIRSGHDNKQNGQHIFHLQPRTSTHNTQPNGGNELFLSGKRNSSRLI